MLGVCLLVGLLADAAQSQQVPADDVYLYVTFNTFSASDNNFLPPIFPEFGSIEAADYYMNVSLQAAWAEWQLPFEPESFNWFNWDGIGAPFKAVLSVDSQGVRDRMIEHVPGFLDRPVFNLLGETIVNGGNDLFGEQVQLFAPIINEFGLPAPENAPVWTGSGTNGSPSNTAGNWTNPGVSATVGRVGVGGNGWIADDLRGSSFGSHLYGVGIVTTPLPGDYNNDYSVDGGDFLHWQRNQGSVLKKLPNDKSPGGPIDQADLAVWQANFGAQRFTTTIDVTDDNAPFYAMGNGGVLNVLPGGVVGDAYDVGTVYDEPFQSEMNVLGGEVGEYLEVHHGGTLNISEGIVGLGLSIRNGGVLNVSGGQFAAPIAVELGSTVNIANGDVTINAAPNVLAAPSAAIDVSGGRIFLTGGGDVTVRGGAIRTAMLSNAAVILAGADFKIDGVAVPGLNEVGQTADINLQPDSVLTGTLSDGTPLVLHLDDGLSSSRIIDSAPSKLSLQSAELPPVGPSLITASTDPAPLGIRAGQTLVVDAGAIVKEDFRVGSGSVLNVAGGEVGARSRVFEGTVNLSSGSIGPDFSAFGSTTVNIAGGSLDSAEIFDGSSLLLAGGSLGRGLAAHAGSTVTISGGAFGDRVSMRTGSSLTMVGGDFQLDGLVITGLVNPGDSIAVDISASNLLSGTLSDGTPFAFSLPDDDSVASGMVTLELANLPPVGPTTITATVDPIPLGLRSGQTLLVDDGGVVADNFQAGSGSAVIVQPGGAVGNNLEAVGATVNVLGGAVGTGFDAFFGTTLNLFSGQVGALSGDVSARLDAFDGSTLNISGGEVLGNVRAHEGSSINLAGGRLSSRMIAEGGSTVVVSGGNVDDKLMALSGSSVHIAGGAFRELSATSGTELSLAGGEFRINGLVVPGLESVGNAVSLTMPSGAILSGTLGDGTPFAFTSGAGGEIPGGMVTLQATSLPPVGPALITASADPVPLGIRGGQTLLVDDAGGVANNFNAGRGSIVEVEAGGSIGENVEAVAATVNVSGGSVGPFFSAVEGSTISMTDGSIGSLSIKGASTALISGGMIGGFSDQGIFGGISVTTGGTVTLSAGEVENDVSVSSGGSVEMNGGVVGGVRTLNGGTFLMTGGSVVGTPFDSQPTPQISISGGGDLTLRGGSFDQLTTLSSSNLTIVGGELRLDGDLIAGLEIPGSTLLLDIPSESVLSGTLADGTPFAISPLDGDFISTGSLTLQAFSSPPAGPPLITASTDPVPLGIRAGQTLQVDTGGVAPRNFNAGLGSVLNVEVGGTVGANLEAFGATININGGVVGRDSDAFAGADVTLSGGVIGNNFEAYSGSSVLVAGGQIGDDFTAHNGSVVTVTGGTIGSGNGDFLAKAGSAVTISGGLINDELEIEPGSNVSLDGGSVVRLTLHEGSSATVSGGTVNRIFSDLNTTTTITGGSVAESLTLRESGVIDIFGGSIDGTLHLPDGQLNLFGTEFSIDGTPLEGLNLNEAFTIIDRNIVLGGILADGSPFSFDMTTAASISAGKFIHPDALLTVTLVSPINSASERFSVPEPSALALMALSYILCQTAQGCRKKVRPNGWRGKGGGKLPCGNAEF